MFSVDTQQLKNGNLIFFSITEPFKNNLEPRFLIKSYYYIVPSPSTALSETDEIPYLLIKNRCISSKTKIEENVKKTYEPDRKWT